MGNLALPYSKVNLPFQW